MRFSGDILSARPHFSLMPAAGSGSSGDDTDRSSSDQTTDSGAASKASKSLNAEDDAYWLDKQQGSEQSERGGGGGTGAADATCNRGPCMQCSAVKTGECSNRQPAARLGESDASMSTP